MPLREYLCDYCGHQFEEFVISKEPGDYAFFECRCGSKAAVLPAMIGGYRGNTGSSSTRPRNSTSMPKKKAYTGHPGNEGEPETQLELPGLEEK